MDKPKINMQNNQTLNHHNSMIKYMKIIIIINPNKHAKHPTQLSQINQPTQTSKATSNSKNNNNHNIQTQITPQNKT